MALAIDGSVQGNAGGAASLAVTLTTTNANDIICVTATCNAGPINSVTASAPGLGTFTQRSTTGGSNSDDFWYAIATQPLSSVSITAAQAGGSAFITVAAFGISGANTTTPFDPNASLPATGTTSATFSTTNANDMILEIVRTTAATGTPDTGFTAIDNGNFHMDADEVVSVVQSSVTLSPGGSNNIIVDAIQAFVPPLTQQVGLAWSDY